MAQYLTGMRELILSLHLTFVIMFALFICSVIATTVFLERLWYLRRSHILPKKFYIEVKDLLERGKVDEAKTLCKREDFPLGRLILVGLEHPADQELTAQQIRARVEDAGRYESSRMEGPSDILGTIAGIAPLLGLLGTVLGMIEIFGVISDEGVGNTTLLASGIATALITTVFGIGLAIPSLVAYKFCLSKAQSLVLEMEQWVATALRTLLYRDSAHAA